MVAADIDDVRDAYLRIAQYLLLGWSLCMGLLGCFLHVSTNRRLDELVDHSSNGELSSGPVRIHDQAQTIDRPRPSAPNGLDLPPIPFLGGGATTTRVFHFPRSRSCDSAHRGIPRNDPGPIKIEVNCSNLRLSIIVTLTLATIV